MSLVIDKTYKFRTGQTLVKKGFFGKPTKYHEVFVLEWDTNTGEEHSTYTEWAKENSHILSLPVQQ